MTRTCGAGAPTPSSLPTVTDHPDRAVVIYDGQCRFCTAQVERLARWGGQQRLAFLSLHDPEVARRWPHLDHDRLMQEMVVVTPDGESYGGAAALRYLSRVLPMLWPVAPFLNLPGSLPLWQLGYRLVARWRYRIAGRHNTDCPEGTCQVHYAALAERTDHDSER